MEDISDKSKQIQLMFDKISPSYDFLNRLLSFGQDVRWRERALSLMPNVLTLDGVHYDIACGTGDVLIGANKNRKDYANFVGIDLSEGMLNIAQKRCLKNGISAQFIHATAEYLPCVEATSHCVTMAFGFRNIENRARALKECHRVLKKTGFIKVVVPHFSNAYFYSDYTHKTFFGLYSFSYMVQDTLLRRKVPNYHVNTGLKLKSVFLYFKSPLLINRPFRRLWQLLFNASTFMKEWYEDSWSSNFPCYEVQFILIKL